MTNEGTFAAVIWPTYAGALGVDATEPIHHSDYRRGQIGWGVGEDGKICGTAIIHVPAGRWRWICYARYPVEGGLVHIQKLSQDLILTAPGAIELHRITESDVRPLNPDRVARD